MLQVNEVFGPTIQGEGKSTGKEVMFVRLSHCNLHCVWCDTPYTWNWIGTKFSHPDKFDKNKEVHEMSDEQIISCLKVKAVVISGGEPMLQQQQLVSLIEKLKGLGYWVEIETNGTVKPLAKILGLVDQINCSPKLANSGDSLKLRERKDALSILSGSDKVSFKFVVSSGADIVEILSYVKCYKMREVYLMPEGRTLDELNAHEEMTRALCTEHGFIFCQRLHIIKFGAKRGV